MPARIVLNPSREKSLLRRHPWVFSKAIKKVEGKPIAGETVDIYDSRGNWIAKGAYSPESQIRVRVWSFDESETIDRQFFKKRFEQAARLREKPIIDGQLTGYRLIAGESDYLPGLTIDVYNTIISCQLLSAGVDFHRHTIFDVLQELYPAHAIYERSDVDVRKKEGMELNKGWISKPLASTETEIIEHGIKIKVDVEQGHKTGFYLDQRDSRVAAGRYAKGKTVLNCFSYTGTFSLHCTKAGAMQVDNVDVSQTALDLAKRNHEINGLDTSKVNFIKEDVFKLLREYRKQGKQYDMIILDPPKFAESKAQLKGACRGYKDINMLAMQLLKPGGTLLTFSCSGLMESSLFQKIVADAALDAGREGRIIERLQQAADHPIALSFPEGYYLKGLVCQID
ncbi:class I SAM-dependent rRNA methyltransferase [Thalassotalea maritima]|uniref:class I SAM-dependent rRNA methyltransferase n=1 Tax=Thalassotalea maritima TaxID=3242416 RepID=UPI00352983E9